MGSGQDFGGGGESMKKADSEALVAAKLLSDFTKINDISVRIISIGSAGIYYWGWEVSYWLGSSLKGKPRGTTRFPLMGLLELTEALVFWIAHKEKAKREVDMIL